jgi:TolB-like protein/Tfp pilus assembly protein PilF/class 3 adenylate cyclase
MPTDLSSDVKFDIGHVLFIDIVGYSKLLITEQSEQIQKLKEIVRGTEQVRLAEAEGKLLRLPTGDGGALVFRTSPEAPVLCAIEIAKALKNFPELHVRMGIHSGPVNEVTDLNEQSNIAGPGVNMAQRVMDCGDAGHILISRHVAEDLEHYPRWQPYLHDLGEFEVKHGGRVHILNLHTEGLGNPEVPRKFTQTSKREVAIPRRKLLILPVSTDDTSREYEYLGDGIAEGIIDILSQLPQLHVIARSTAFRYRESGADFQELARKLEVDTIFTGHLRKRETDLSIRVELIDIRAGTQLWGQRFECKPETVMNIETSLSAEIAEKLRVRFTAQQQLHAVKSQTESKRAYQLYLKGRYHCNKRNEKGLRTGITLFKDALDEDPAFAKAWAGLADCYALLGCWGFDAPRHSYPKAKAAAEKAIALDDYLAEAHASLAVTRKDYEWDWAGAGHEYRRALELNPSYALGHHWYGEYLACVGKHPEAIKELEQACELDPLSPMIAATLGRHGYYFARDFERACEQLRKVTRRDPEFWVAHNFLGWVLTLTGEWPRAIEEFTIAHQLDQNAETLVGVGYVQGLTGNVDAARETLAQLAMLRRNSYVQPVSIALIHVGLAENDEAFAWLDKAYDENAQWLSEIKTDPAFDPLRSDARFAELLERIGLGQSKIEQ